MFLQSAFILLCHQISELQKEAVIRKIVEQRSKTEKRSRNSAASVTLLCRNCLEPVASGSDIKLIDNVHYVNVNRDFK